MKAMLRGSHPPMFRRAVICGICTTMRRTHSTGLGSPGGCSTSANAVVSAGSAGSAFTSVALSRTLAMPWMRLRPSSWSSSIITATACWHNVPTTQVQCVVSARLPSSRSRRCAVTDAELNKAVPIPAIISSSFSAHTCTPARPISPCLKSRPPSSICCRLNSQSHDFERTWVQSLEKEKSSTTMWLIRVCLRIAHVVMQWNTE